MTSIYLHDNTKPLKLEVAVSDLQDVARMQGSNHKTLVKNRGDDGSMGAGGVNVMHEDILCRRRGRICCRQLN
ncbi:MAG: hypothetical protein LAC69_07695 [Chlorobium sp.]|nr:hypothetical protein [Chlorobium sp.]